MFESKVDRRQATTLHKARYGLGPYSLSSAAIAAEGLASGGEPRVRSAWGLEIRAVQAPRDSKLGVAKGVPN